MIELAEYGYWGLFMASFLAATVLPFSSEALLGMMLLGNFDFTFCLITASAGNWLGGMSSYFIGSLGKWEWIEKYLKISKHKVEALKSRLDKYGSYFALLCWAPVVGDPIAVALGFFRINGWKVAALMLTGKTIRYFILGWLIIKGSELYR